MFFTFYSLRFVFFLYIIFFFWIAFAALLLQWEIFFFLTSCGWWRGLRVVECRRMLNVAATATSSQTRARVVFFHFIIVHNLVLLWIVHGVCGVRTHTRVYISCTVCLSASVFFCFFVSLLLLTSQYWPSFTPV